MSEFVVHGVPGSPYVRIALLGLEEKCADWRLAPMSFGSGKGPDHLAKHPFGRIPILDHGDFRLYETQAILRYLDRVIPNPPLTPTDPRAEARMNQLCGITDSYVMPDISAGIAFDRVVKPKFGLPVDEAKIEGNLPKARICLDEVARLLGQQTFMAGERLSLADLMLAPHLDFLGETPEGKALLAPHVNLRAWITRMEERSSMRNTTWEKLNQLAMAS